MARLRETHEFANALDCAVEVAFELPSRPSRSVTALSVRIGDAVTRGVVNTPRHNGWFTVMACLREMHEFANALNSLSMRIGDVVTHSVIRESEQVRAEYDDTAAWGSWSVLVKQDSAGKAMLSLGFLPLGQTAIMMVKSAFEVPMSNGCLRITVLLGGNQAANTKPAKKGECMVEGTFQILCKVDVQSVECFTHAATCMLQKDKRSVVAMLKPTRLLSPDFEVFMWLAGELPGPSTCAAVTTAGDLTVGLSFFLSFRDLQKQITYMQQLALVQQQLHLK
eukprot:m51a1_g12022 hypothetical protein (280) ;mRNA; f:11-4407